MDQASNAGKTLTAYVDGSYNDDMKRYAFGCVFLPPWGSIYLAMGNGENPETVSMRNVTGEMLGAMYAVKTAMKNGFSAIEIYYDYEGIEKWVSGAWKAKKEHTQKYAAAMRQWGQQIQIGFHKVAAHTKVEYNELADQTAKRGLEEGKGIPPIRMLEELETWN
ncbi:MAG: reverse transcriptase-like protein [Lachnospiraceae bacterium]|nr:reverse transcriptase-like protein [Lachnospiraceae bacterium]